MERARRCDHEAVKLAAEKLLKRAGALCSGSELERLGEVFRIGVADRDRVRLASRQHRLHAIAADPAGAEETQPHGTTTAFTKLPGRSRVAFSASPSLSSG